MVVLDLNAQWRRAAPQQTDFSGAPEGQPEEGQHFASALQRQAIELTIRVLSSIQRHVFLGDSFSDMADQADEIKTRLRTETGPSLLPQAGDQIASILQTFEERLRESNRETAVDFQKVLSLLSESFSCIQADNEQAEERLRYFEQGLSHATKIDSLVSLRQHLSGMLKYARTQGRIDVADKENRLRSISEQLEQARAAGSRLRVHMPGRPEALDYIRNLLAASDGKSKATVGLFVVDTLSALRARHGEEIACNILEELSRKQIQPLEQNGRIFCWSPSALILVSQPKTSLNSAGLLHSVPSTFEHRAFLGARVATFKVKVRSISTPLTRGLDEVVATLDRFCKENAA